MDTEIRVNCFVVVGVFVVVVDTKVLNGSLRPKLRRPTEGSHAIDTRISALAAYCPDPVAYTGNAS